MATPKLPQRFSDEDDIYSLNIDDTPFSYFNLNKLASVASDSSAMEVPSLQLQTSYNNCEFNVIDEEYRKKIEVQ